MTEPLAATYADARQRFCVAAQEAGATVTAFVHPDRRGPDGGQLAIDVAELGPADAAAVVLVMSGTHGVEGYAGSALQTRWLRTGTDDLTDGLRVVLVHGFNPYGFAWHRRTNEDNVDLNRNFIDWSAPPPENPGYDELADLLVPERWDDDARTASTAAVLEVAERVGLDELQRAITGGQYRHPGGLFYGGSGPVWSHRWLVDNVEALLGRAARLAVIDLHTGLGPWGIGELIVHTGRTDPVCRRAEEWWGDVRSMTDGESVSAKLDGDWLGVIGSLVPRAELTAAALEFGTLDDVAVLQSLRGEAWAHTNGERGTALADRIRTEVRASFADDNPAWIEALAERFDGVIGAAVTNLV